MMVKILFFAEAKKIVGEGEIDLSFNGKTVLDIKRDLLEKYPSLETSFNSVVFAVNEKYTAEDTVLKDGDVLAVIPPVGGG
ncbi:MAG: MoaD/ThiS family protein [Caldisericota bacterium]|nr:MoaD/ThiS family protein [Caldisericota bacterium]